MISRRLCGAHDTEKRGASFEIADDLVPFRAQARFQHQSFTRRPVVLNVLRGLEILARLKGTALEGNVAGHGTVVAQDFVVVAHDVLVKRLPLEVDPELQLVRAQQVQRGQEQVGDPLLPVGVAVDADEIVSQVPEGRDFE